MTNSQAIAETFNRQCTGDHRHVMLEGRKTREGQVYPDGLCRAIIEGLKKQMRIDGRVSSEGPGVVMLTEEGSKRDDGENGGQKH